MGDRQSTGGQLTPATWVTIVIAVASIVANIGLGIRGSYYQSIIQEQRTDLSTVEGRVSTNHTDISVVKNDISTIKTDLHEIKVALGVPNGKVK